MRIGGVCSGPSAKMFAPISRSGAITRSMGRRERPASPTRRLSNVCPESRPARSRIVVPEFPQLMSFLGGVRTRFFPWTISVSGAGCSILTPKARMALTVRMQSSLGRKPPRVHTPLDKAAMITARCEILLSPGTVISRSSRGARLIRNSIDEVLKFFAKRTRHPRAREEHHRTEGAVVQPCSPETNLRFVRSISPGRALPKLRNEKDFVRIGILHFRSWRKAFHIDVFARRIRTFHEMGFARDGNSVG